MLPFRVQDAEDNDPVALHAIEKFVGETACKQPAKVPVIKRTAFGIFLQKSNRAADLIQQFITQACAPGFIP